MSLISESFGLWEPHLNMLQLWDVNLGRRILADCRVYSIEGVPVPDFYRGRESFKGNAARAVEGTK